MFCKNCGAEIKDGKFCSNCGTEVEVIKPEVVDVEKSKSSKELKKERRKEKAYGALAKVGFGLGLGTFVCSLVCPISMAYGVAAFILSCFGKKSENHRRLAEKGFKFSLAGLIINTISIVLAFVYYYFIFVFLLLI